MAGIAEVAKEAGLTTQAVKDVFESVSRLAAIERVTIKGFGGFQVKETAARTGRNPQTGEPMQIEAKQVLKFSAAKPKKN